MRCPKCGADVDEVGLRGFVEEIGVNIESIEDVNDTIIMKVSESGLTSEELKRLIEETSFEGIEGSDLKLVFYG